MNPTAPVPSLDHPFILFFDYDIKYQVSVKEIPI